MADGTVRTEHDIPTTPPSDNLAPSGSDDEDEHIDEEDGSDGEEDAPSGTPGWRKRKHRTFWQWVRDQARKVKKAIRKAE